MAFEEDYDVDEIGCPECGTATHSRHCLAFDCDDGWIDEYEDDPLNFAPGEYTTRCEECHGTGIQRWCPNCGWEWRGEWLKAFYI